MPDENLVFVGNWEFSDYGKLLKDKYSNVANIHLLDAIYDLNILDQIRSNCVAYIHGHSSGGTNPSLVEAMHLELPIIAFDVNFNRYTTQDGAFYFSNVDKLAEHVKHNNIDAYRLCAIKMKAIANKIYIWRYIIDEYEKLF
jgi:glycosyltransferase involved in cell wall biosynthesis